MGDHHQTSTVICVIYVIASLFPTQTGLGIPIWIWPQMKNTVNEFSCYVHNHFIKSEASVTLSSLSTSSGLGHHKHMFFLLILFSIHLFTTELMRWNGCVFVFKFSRIFHTMHSLSGSISQLSFVHCISELQEEDWSKFACA